MNSCVGGGRQQRCSPLRLFLLLIVAASLSPSHCSPPNNVGAAHESNGGVRSSVLTDKSNQEKEPPNNFLRWRKTQQQTIEGKTNEDFFNASISNDFDFDENSGMYVEFGSFGIQLSPVALPSSYTNDDMNGVMPGIKYAIEAHLNTTLRDVVYTGADYISGRFGFARLDEVKFVEATYSGEDARKRVRTRGESVRGLDSYNRGLSTRGLQTGAASMTVFVSGGRAFYLSGGMFLTSSIPTPSDVDTIIINNVEKAGNGNGGNIGGVLARQIRGLATNSADMEMFRTVQSVQVVEGLELSPTDSPITDAPSPQPTVQPTKFPTPQPTPLPSNQPTPFPTKGPTPQLSTAQLGTPSPTTKEPTTAMPTTWPPAEEIPLPGVDYTSPAQIAQDVPTSSPDTGSPSVSPTTNSPTGPLPFSGGRPTGLDTLVNVPDPTSGDEGDMSNDANMNQAQAYNDNSENNNTKNIILASTLAALLVLAAAGLFVYKRHRDQRKFDMEANRGVDEIMKSVPMSKLTDDEHDPDSSGGDSSDMYNGFFDVAVGDRAVNVPQITATSQDTHVVGKDVERGQEQDEEQGMWQDVERAIESQSPQNDDEVYDRLMANALTIGAANVAATSGNNRADAEGELMSQHDSVMPQFDEATRQAHAMDRDLETIDGAYEAPEDELAEDADITNSYDEDDDANSNIEPLGSHDSLNLKYPMSDNITPKDFGDLDALAGLGNTEDIVYDDIDEAMKLAHTSSNVSDEVMKGEIEEVMQRAAALAAVNGFMMQSGESQADGGQEGDNIDVLAPNPSETEDPSKSDSFASHNILNDINQAAVERKRSLGSQKGISSREGTPFSFGFDESNIVFSTDEDDSIHVTTEETHGANKAEEGRTTPVVSTTPKEPEEENFVTHNILDAISEAAQRSTASRSSPSLKADVFVPTEISARSNVVSPTSTIPTQVVSSASSMPLNPLNDPPGSKDDETDVFAVLKIDPRNKFSVSPVTAPKDDESDIFADLKIDRTNTFAVSPSAEDNNYDIDQEDQQYGTSRPWKERWDTDPFANQGGLRTVSPTFEGGSNYDPDSDWDVDDTEVEFGLNEEPFHASPSIADNENDAPPRRIW